MFLTADITLVSTAVHPGIVNSPWYLKVDQHAYLFSWTIHTVRSIIGSWIRVGQSPITGAISLIYASIDPSLTGSTSNPRSTGIIDSITRAAFGGRLKYYGPSYILQNFNNAGTSIALNPWVYMKGACSRLYDASMGLVADVERRLAQGEGQQQQQGLLGDQQFGQKGYAAAVRGDGMMNGASSAVKAAPRSGVVDAPLGPSLVAQQT